jgi:hypothetical protein
MDRWSELMIITAPLSTLADTLSTCWDVPSSCAWCVREGSCVVLHGAGVIPLATFTGKPHVMVQQQQGLILHNGARVQPAVVEHLRVCPVCWRADESREAWAVTGS